MGSDAQTLTFEPVEWCNRTENDLAKIADVTAREMDIFRARVEAGEFQLLAAELDGERVGSVIWSVEQETDGASIVINAAACRAIGGVCVTSEINKRMLELGRSLGARCLRCWTARSGLVRKLETLGATRRYVMEVEIGRE